MRVAERDWKSDLISHSPSRREAPDYIRHMTSSSQISLTWLSSQSSSLSAEYNRVITCPPAVTENIHAGVFFPTLKQKPENDNEKAGQMMYQIRAVVTQILLFPVQQELCRVQLMLPSLHFRQKRLQTGPVKAELKGNGNTNWLSALKLLRQKTFVQLDVCIKLLTRGLRDPSAHIFVVVFVFFSSYRNRSTDSGHHAAYVHQSPQQQWNDISYVIFVQFYKSWSQNIPHAFKMCIKCSLITLFLQKLLWKTLQCF